MATTTKDIVAYQLYDADDTLLYVGITSNWSAREQMHRRETKWWSDVARVEFEECATPDAASDREVELIASLQPRYNRVKTRRALRVTPDHLLSVPVKNRIPPGTDATLDRLAEKLRMGRGDILCLAIYRLACVEGVPGPNGTVGKNPEKLLQERISQLEAALAEIAAIAYRQGDPE